VPPVLPTAGVPQPREARTAPLACSHRGYPTGAKLEVGWGAPLLRRLRRTLLLRASSVLSSRTGPPCVVRSPVRARKGMPSGGGLLNDAGVTQRGVPRSGVWSEATLASSEEPRVTYRPGMRGIFSLIPSGSMLYVYSRHKERRLPATLRSATSNKGWMRWRYHAGVRSGPSSRRSQGSVSQIA
jgi:hypothetical protein